MFITMLSLAAALVVTDATAADMSERSALQIGHGDLDLNSPAGKAEFDRRVDRAASTFCEDWPVKISVSQRREIEACKKRIQLDAARQVARTTGDALARAQVARPIL